MSSDRMQRLDTKALENILIMVNDALTLYLNAEKLSREIKEKHFVPYQKRVGFQKMVDSIRRIPLTYQQLTLMRESGDRIIIMRY